MSLNTSISGLLSSSRVKLAITFAQFSERWVGDVRLQSSQT
jgi:hypothetical protein